MACWVSVIDCRRSARSRPRKSKRCSHSLYSSSAIMLIGPIDSIRDLQFVILRVGSAQLLARQQGGEFRDQIFRLRVQLLDAGLPQVFAFGLVAGALDFVACCAPRGNRRAFGGPCAGCRPPVRNARACHQTPAPFRRRALRGAAFRRAAIPPAFDAPQSATPAVLVPARASRAGEPTPCAARQFPEVRAPSAPRLFPRSRRRSASAAISARRDARSSCLRLGRLPQSDLLLHGLGDFLFRSRSCAGNLAAPVLRSLGAPLGRRSIIAQATLVRFGNRSIRFPGAPCRLAPGRAAKWQPLRVFRIRRAARWLVRASSR